jgi:pyridoxine kinase
VADFVLRRLGLDCWSVDTVTFSNHPGYGRHRGRVGTAAEIAELVEGLAAVDVLARCRAVLSGYLGSPANGGVVLKAVAQVKRLRPGAPWCCDPVIGDRDSGCYVAHALIRFFAEDAVPAADILTPNHFELEVLAGRPLPALADVLDASDQLRTRGPRLIIVSSVLVPELAPGRIGTLLVADDGAWLVATPCRRLQAKGAGDLLAALFLGRLLLGSGPVPALEAAVAATFAVIETTRAAGCERHELKLVPAQAALVSPPTVFPADRLG